MNKQFVKILFFSLLLSLSAFAQGGKDGGNGGDGYTLEFKSIAKSIVKHWFELGFTQQSAVTREEFSNAILTADVHSVDEKLYVDGFEVDAKNYEFCPPGKKSTALYCGTILLNRKRWDDLASDLAKKTALVFHEYLGVLGKTTLRFDDYYEISSERFETLRAILNSQLKIDVSFVCLLQGWDSEKRRVSVLQVLESKLGSDNIWFKYEKTEYSLQIRSLYTDYFAKALTPSLSYGLYLKNKEQLPDYKNPLAFSTIEFKSGKRSVRILNDPEFQLDCYRTYEGIR